MKLFIIDNVSYYQILVFVLQGVGIKVSIGNQTDTSWGLLWLLLLADWLPCVNIICLFYLYRHPIHA